MSNALAASAGNPAGVPVDSVAFPAGTSTAPAAPFLSPTFTSGTAAQLSDTSRDYMVYIAIATGGGTVSVAIGPTSTPANTIVSSVTGVNGAVIPVRLPAGWFLKITAATSTIGAVTAVGC